MKKGWITVLVAAWGIGGIMDDARGQGHNGGHGLATGIDCTEIDIEYQYNPLLSDAENLALMERLFYQSLEKFDYCHNSQANQGGGQAGSGGGGSSSNGAGTKTASQPGGLQGSQAAMAASSNGDASLPSGLSGTESVLNNTVTRSMSEAMLEDTATNPMTSDNQPEKMLPNGAIPKDIPPADNDDMLAAQIRQAAIEEPDPEIQARLWDEYRSYKGLPTTSRLE